MWYLYSSFGRKKLKLSDMWRRIVLNTLSEMWGLREQPNIQYHFQVLVSALDLVSQKSDFKSHHNIIFLNLGHLLVCLRKKTSFTAPWTAIVIFLVKRNQSCNVSQKKNKHQLVTASFSYKRKGRKEEEANKQKKEEKTNNKRKGRKVREASPGYKEHSSGETRHGNTWFQFVSEDEKYYWQTKW